MADLSERQTLILARLADGRLATSFDLSGATNVSERTIYRDIASLRAMGSPIASDRGWGGGYMLRKRQGAAHG